MLLLLSTTNLTFSSIHLLFFLVTLVFDIWYLISCISSSLTWLNWSSNDRLISMAIAWSIDLNSSIGGSWVFIWIQWFAGSSVPVCQSLRIPVFPLFLKIYGYYHLQFVLSIVLILNWFYISANCPSLFNSLYALKYCFSVPAEEYLIILFIRK